MSIGQRQSKEIILVAEITYQDINALEESVDNLVTINDIIPANSVVSEWYFDVKEFVQESNLYVTLKQVNDINYSILCVPDGKLTSHTPIGAYTFYQTPQNVTLHFTYAFDTPVVNPKNYTAGSIKIYAQLRRFPN